MPLNDEVSRVFWGLTGSETCGSGTSSTAPRPSLARSTVWACSVCPFPSKVSSGVVANLPVVQVRWDFRASLVSLELRNFLEAVGLSGPLPAP